TGLYAPLQVGQRLVVLQLATALELSGLDVEDGLGGLLAAHDAVARAGQREDEARRVRLAAHGVMARPVRAAQYDGQPGHHAVGNRVNQFGAAADDAVLLALLAHHEAVDVVQEDYGYAGLVAVEHEAGGLVRCFGVDDAAYLYGALAFDDQFLVGHHAHRVAAEAPHAGYKRLAVVGLELVELRAVQQAGQHGARVVRLGAAVHG